MSRDDRIWDFYQRRGTKRTISNVGRRILLYLASCFEGNVDLWHNRLRDRFVVGSSQVSEFLCSECE